jgi:hypothetical protein
MEQGPSGETDSSLGNQEIPLVLWNPKVHYRVHNSPSPDPILSQLNSDNTCFLKINFNIILPSKPTSDK